MNKEIKSEILSITSSISEVVLDSFLYGIFKDITVVGTAISIINLRKNISDQLLLQKILSFLVYLNLKTEKEIEAFKAKYLEMGDQNLIGGKILNVLNRIDEDIKTKWLARAFKLYIERQIERTDFTKICSIIGNSYTDDVQLLLKLELQGTITNNNNLVPKDVMDHLFSIGLLEVAGFDGGTARVEDGGLMYRVNKFGRIFYKNILTDNLSS